MDVCIYRRKQRKVAFKLKCKKKKDLKKKKSLAALRNDPNYNTARLALKDVWRSKRSC